MADSETIQKKKPDDFPTIIAKTVVSIDWFLYLIIVVAFMIVSSDIFTRRILQNINGAMKGDEITTWGYIMQALGMIVIIVMGRIAESYL